MGTVAEPPAEEVVSLVAEDLSAAEGVASAVGAEVALDAVAELSGAEVSGTVVSGTVVTGTVVSGAAVPVVVADEELDAVGAADVVDAAAVVVRTELSVVVEVVDAAADVEAADVVATGVAAADVVAVDPAAVLNAAAVATVWVVLVAETPNIDCSALARFCQSC